MADGSEASSGVDPKIGEQLARLRALSYPARPSIPCIVPTSYRHHLRELNELNFARFNATLEQRLADFRASLSEQMAQLATSLNERMSQLEVRLSERMSQLEVRFERRLGEQSRWLVGIWITVIGAAVALWFRR